MSDCIVSTMSDGELLLLDIEDNSLRTHRSSLRGPWHVPVRGILQMNGWICIHCDERLWVVTVEPHALRAIANRAVKALPDFSADVVWYCSSGVPVMRSVDQSGAVCTEIAVSRGGTEWVPMMITPSGEVIAAASDESAYCVLGLERVDAVPESWPRGSRFIAAHGGRVATMTRDGELFIVDLEADDSQLLNRLEGNPTKRAFSPDGQHLAIALLEFGPGRRRRLVVCSASSGWQPVEVPVHDAAEYLDFTWSTDSERLYAVTDDASQLHAFDPAGAWLGDMTMDQEPFALVRAVSQATRAALI